jgi:LAO/AO transport system kinase
VKTVATTGDGVEELFDAVATHRAHLVANGEAASRRRGRLRDELRGLVAARIAERVDALCEGPHFDAVVDEVAARTRDPYAAVDALLAS